MFDGKTLDIKTTNTESTKYGQFSKYTSGSSEFLEDYLASYELSSLNFSETDDQTRTTLFIVDQAYGGGAESTHVRTITSSTGKLQKAELIYIGQADLENCP